MPLTIFSSPSLTIHTLTYINIYFHVTLPLRHRLAGHPLPPGAMRIQWALPLF